MRKQIIGMLAVVTFAVITMTFGGSASAQESSQGRFARKCHLMTLKGSYGYLNTGSFAGTPLASVGIMTFDGAGNVSGNDTNSFGGSISSTPFTGSYTVNDDCSGTLTVNFGFFSITNNMVIVENGKEINVIETNPGSVATGVFKRQ